MKTKILNKFYSWDQTTCFTGVKAPKVSLIYEAHKGLNIQIQAPLIDTDRLEMPSGRLWGLWEHEVVEVFLVGTYGEYIELEFGPWGHYLSLYLSGVRHIKNDHCPIEDFEVYQEYDAVLQTTVWYCSCWVSLPFLPKLQSVKDSRSIHREKKYWQYNAFWCFREYERILSYEETLSSSKQKTTLAETEVHREKKRYLCCAYPLPGQQPDFHQPQLFPRWFPQEYT